MAFETELYNKVQARRKTSSGYAGTPIYNLTLSDTKRIKKSADKFGLKPEWISNLVNFETGGTFSPAITNSIGATGLIQFLPSTATSLGTTTDALRKMTFQQQMDWVDKYLQANFNRLPSSLFNKTTNKITTKFTQTDLFMMIFYPVSVGNNNYQFPANVVAANGGIRTPLEYAKKALTSLSAPFASVSNFITATQQTGRFVARNWHWFAIGAIALSGLVYGIYKGVQQK
jgi:hypothetical protein